MTENKLEVHMVLLHHPVVNKIGEIVSTAVTNLDIHDNARSSRTFGLKSYHIVTPLDAQVELVSRILGHWRDGHGARRVPNRADAINLVEVSRTLHDAVDAMATGTNKKPYLISTAARRQEGSVSYGAMREEMARLADTHFFVLIFGTGYGLADEVIAGSDAILDPIGNPTDWNHLSVRGAVAIILDRLFGDR